MSFKKPTPKQEPQKETPPAKPKRTAQKATPKASDSKAIVRWDEELAKQAEIAAGMEANTGGGQFFSIRAGVLSWQDSPLPNNEMAVVILDTLLENVYYEGAFDPDVISPPTCFALGREEKDMEPHIIVREAQQAQSLEGCGKCEHNEWGSADKGRGKACRNTRRLALIPAGQFARDGSFEAFDEESHYASTSIGFLKLPVTSVKGYAGFVKQVAGTLKRPPFGIFTRVSVVPDAKTQFKVVFEALDKVPNELLSVIMSRVEEAKSTIDFPYSLEREERTPPKKGSTTARRAPVNKRKY